MKPRVTPSRSPSGELGKQAKQRGALTLGQLLQHNVLDAIHGSSDTADLDQSGFGDRNGVATAIVSVALPAYETSRDEVVDRGDDITGVDAGRATHVSLACWTMFFERSEDTEVISAHARAGEGVTEQCLGASVGSPEEPGRPSRDALQR